MKIMLDTNIVVYMIKNKDTSMLNNIYKFTFSDICISSITLAELEYGIEKSIHKEQNRLALLYFLTLIEVVPYTEKAASCYGKIRSELEKNGNLLGSLDMLVASHAMALSYTLITNNIKELSTVNDLKLDNWASR